MLAFVLAATVLTSFVRASVSPSVQIVSEAAALYDQAIMTYTSDPILARSLFAQAAAAMTRASQEFGSSAELQRALGNALLLSEQPGRAILALQRSLSLDPRSPQTRDALDAARATVQVQIAPSSVRRVEDVLSAWVRYVPPRVVQVLLIVSWTALWIMIARATSAHLTGRSTRIAAWQPVLASILVFMSASALAFEQWDRRTDHRLVILNPTFGFNGPSRDVYASTFEQTLPPGTEADALESRHGWTHIRLRSGAKTWVPSDTFEFVHPPAR
jgi:hypothetical protein